eukprot:2635164-Rhodomonas_salina.5
MSALDIAARMRSTDSREACYFEGIKQLHIQVLDGSVARFVSEIVCVHLDVSDLAVSASWAQVAGWAGGRE